MYVITNMRLQDNKILPVGLSFESAKEILIELQKIGINFSVGDKDDLDLINVRNLDSVSELSGLRDESINYSGLFIGKPFSSNFYFVLKEHNLNPSETLKNLLLEAEEEMGKSKF